jgi:hypothetical protein
MKKIREIILIIPGLKIFIITFRRMFFQIFFNISVFWGAGFNTQSALLRKEGVNILIWFDPNIITQRAPGGSNRNFVQKLDKDGIKTIDESTPNIAPTIEQMFVKNESYELTPQFDKMIKQVNRGQRAYYCETVEDVHRYFQNLEKAYQSISTDGYLLQKELKEKDESLIDPRYKLSYQDEIQVVIDGNGDMLLGWAGTHRLLIARILKLDRVPGFVKYLEEEWAEKVFNVSNTKNLQKAIEAKIKEMSLH